MMSIANLGVLQAQTWLSTRVLYTFDKKITDVDKEYQIQRFQPEHRVPALMCKNSLVTNPVHAVFIYD